MAYYYNIKTNEYPRHDGDLELLGWQFGSNLPEHWVEVEDSAYPEISSTQVCEEGTPVQIDGVWKRNWILRDVSPEESEMRNTPYPLDKGPGPFKWNASTKEWILVVF